MELFSKYFFVFFIFAFIINIVFIVCILSLLINLCKYYSAKNKEIKNRNNNDNYYERN